LSTVFFLYFVTNNVDIKLGAHDAPPEQSALGTLKIERLDRQATQKCLGAIQPTRTAMVTRARGNLGFDYNYTN